MKIILTKTLSLSTLFLISHIVALQSQNIQLKKYLINLPITSKLGGSNSRPLATSEAFTFIGANTPEEYKNDFQELISKDKNFSQFIDNKDEKEIKEWNKDYKTPAGYDKEEDLGSEEDEEEES